MEPGKHLEWRMKQTGGGGGGRVGIKANRVPEKRELHRENSEM